MRSCRVCPEGSSQLKISTPAQEAYCAARVVNLVFVTTSPRIGSTTPLFLRAAAMSSRRALTYSTVFKSVLNPAALWNLASIKVVTPFRPPPPSPPGSTHAPAIIWFILVCAPSARNNSEIYDSNGKPDGAKSNNARTERRRVGEDRGVRGAPDH